MRSHLHSEVTTIY